MRRKLFAILVAASLPALMGHGEGCGSGDEEATALGALTGATCPDRSTLTYETFGRNFMESYCTRCHSSTLSGEERRGAPLYHDFDTLEGARSTPDHIDEQAGFGPNAENLFMPPERCPSTKGGPLDKKCDMPTAEERRNLAMWIACERKRTFMRDAGIDAP